MPSPAKLFVLGLLAALAVATAASVSDATTEASKRLKCKRGYVVVKVNKKASCRRMRSVVPKPKAGNRTLADLKAALNIDRSDLLTKRGKRPRALPRRVAAAQRKGRKAMLRALPKLGAMLRRLEQRAGTSRSRHVRASARRPCGGPGSTEPVSDTGHSGALGIQATLGPNGEEGGVMTLTVNGITQETTFVKCGSKYYYVPGCPKSNGDAGTTASGRFTSTTRTLEGRRLISSQYTDWTYDDRLLGKVMDDAKLRYFDFTRKEHKLTVASGGLVQAGDARRTVRVNMPSGSYDAARSRSTITGDASSFREDDLATSIKMAIDEYREAENGGSFLHTDGWATFDRQRDPYCAKAEFSPAAEAITVKKSQQYQLSVYAKGEDGGRATGARWTVIGPEQRDFHAGNRRGPDSEHQLHRELVAVRRPRPRDAEVHLHRRRREGQLVGADRRRDQPHLGHLQHHVQRERLGPDRHGQRDVRSPDTGGLRRSERHVLPELG